MASASNTALSLNIVMNSAIKGANFLQASTQGIYKYSSQVQRIQLLKATKFGSLNSNIKTLDNHLTKMAIKANQIAKTTIKFDVNRDALMSARKDLTAMAKDSQTIFNYSKQTNRVRREGAVALSKPQPQTVTQPIQTVAQKRLSSFRGTSATDVVAKTFIAGTMLMPFKPAIQFEDEMARVKALSRATPLEFKGLVKEAKYLGAKTEWKATEVSQGMSYLSMAGFKPKETQQAMSGVLSLATAGKTDLATTSDIASNILSGFELQASQMDHVADVMARTITTSNTTVQMLGDTFKYVAPVSSKLGADLTEVATLTAKMGDVGIQGSQSGTALRAMYSRLSAPPKSADDALSELGIKTFDESGKFKGMITIIGELKKSLSNKTDEEKSAYVKDIFGMEAMSGALAVMAVGKDKLLEYQESLKNSKGASKEIADIQLDTASGQFKLFGSAMEGLSISVTSNLLPTIKMITKGVTTLTSGIQSFSEKYPTLTSVIVGGTATILAGGIALTAFGFAATMASKGVQSLGFLKTLTSRFSALTSSIIKATTKQKAFNSLLSAKASLNLAPTATTKASKKSFTKLAKNSKLSTFPVALEPQLPVGKRRVKTAIQVKQTKKVLMQKALLGNTFSAFNTSENKSTFTKLAKGTKLSTVASAVSATATTGTISKVATSSKFSKLTSKLSFGTMGIKKNISLITRFNSLISRSTMLLRGIGMALVSNPLGLAVTAMVASGMLLYSKWQPIKAFFVGFGQGVSEALSPLAGDIKSVFSTVFSIFQPVANMAKRIFKWFGEITGASKWSKKELDGVASTGKKVGLIVGKVFTMAMTPVKMLLKAIQSVLNSIGMVSKKIKGVMSDAKKAVINAKNNMVSKVSNVKNKVLSFIGLGDKKSDKKSIVSKPVNNVITSKPTFNKSSKKGVLSTHKPSGTFESSPIKAPKFHKTESFNQLSESHLSLTDKQSSSTSAVKKTDVSIGNISVAVHTQAKDLDADMVQAKVEKALREIKFNDHDLTHEDVAS